MSKRAVLYARVSGDDRDNEGRNLEGQITMCREYAIKQGYQIITELQEDDRGAPGASFELPGLNQARDMASNGSYDVLVVREIDRLSRSLAKQLVVEEELKREGVEIAYVLAKYDDTPEGRLNKHIRATIAKYEREKINERMVRGRRQKVRAGSVLVAQHPPYGYKVVEYDQKYHLDIYEPEAQIVRMIYSWYIDGDGENGPLPIRAISRRLSDLGIPIPKNGVITGKNWAHQTVRKFLKSETYVGKWTYGKTRRGKINGPENYIFVDVPTVVNPEIWEKAQAQLKKNQKLTSNNVRHEYLMRSRLICGACGSRLHSKAYRYKKKIYQYYICPAHQDKVCGAKNGNVIKIDNAIWEWVKSIILNPQALEQGLRTYQDENQRDSEPFRERLQVTEELISEYKDQLERLLDIYLSGNLNREMLVDRKNRLEMTISALEDERADLLKYIEAKYLTQDQLDSVKEFAKQVKDRLTIVEEDYQKRRRIIEILDVSGTLALEDNEQVLYVRCIVGEEIISIKTTATSG